MLSSKCSKANCSLVCQVCFLNAFLTLADNSLFMKDSCEECNASKCSTINGSVEYHADNSLFIVDGKFTFVPKTSWWGLKTLMKQFLGLRAYARALSHWQLTSSLTFKRIPVKIALCRSHIPLQPGNSAGAVDIFTLTFLQKPDQTLKLCHFLYLCKQQLSLMMIYLMITVSFHLQLRLKYSTRFNLF